jgi:hypothetical protein
MEAGAALGRVAVCNVFYGSELFDGAAPNKTISPIAACF